MHGALTAISARVLSLICASTSRPGDGVQLDLPKAREGGLDAAFFAVDCTRPWGNHLLYFMDALGCFLQEVEEHSEEYCRGALRGGH